MEWIATPESSNLNRFGYDPARRVMRVEFKNGATYDYFDVPQNIFQQMRNAGSKGGYLASDIKGRFRYARV